MSLISLARASVATKRRQSASEYATVSCLISPPHIPWRAAVTVAAAMNGPSLLGGGVIGVQVTGDTGATRPALETDPGLC